MDPLEEQKNKNQIDAELKAAINKELSSFMNPKTGETAPANAPEPETLKNPINTNDTIPSTGISESALSSIEAQARPASVIRTYKSDVEETMQAGHISSVNIAVAQNEKMQSGLRQGILEEEKKSKINKSVLIIIGVIVIGGALAILIPLYLISQQTAPKNIVVEKVSSDAIISTELEEKININDIDLSHLSTVLKQRVDQSNTSLGQMKNIYLTVGTSTGERLITASEFLSYIPAHVTSEINITLKPQYMFGMYNFTGNQRFLILKVGSYDTAFSGMLKWEPDLWQNFKEIFELTDTISATTTATSTGATSTNTNSTPNFGITIKQFQDATFNNKDARVVKDASGNIIFLYSIIDDNTVVITTSVDTLKELINRVGRSRVVTQ